MEGTEIQNNPLTTQLELIFQDECAIKDLLSKKLIQTQNESKEIESLILEKKHELNLLEKLYSLINDSVSQKKRIIELIDKSSINKNVQNVCEQTLKDDESECMSKSNILDTFSYEEEEDEFTIPLTPKLVENSNSTTIENQNINDQTNELIADNDEITIQNLNIPLDPIKPIIDPRLSNQKYLNKDDKFQDLLLVNFIDKDQITASDNTEKSSIDNSKLVPLLNLNLPSSISSILFQANNSSKQIENNNTKTQQTSNRDPRLRLAPVEKKTETSCKDMAIVDKNQNPPNPIFNRIQQVLQEGFNNQKPIKKQNNNVYVVEKNGIRISRTKPPPNLMDLEGPKSELVKLYEAETFEFDFTKLVKEKTDWILIDQRNKVVKNFKLKNIIKRRNELIISKIDEKVLNELKNNENDVINDFKMIMNYDFCNNKYMIKKKGSKKSNNDRSNKKEIQKSEIKTNIFNELLSDLVNNEDQFNIAKQADSNNENNFDDLYGDLNNLNEVNIEDDLDFDDNTKEINVGKNLEKPKGSLNESDSKENKIENKSSKNNTNTKMELIQKNNSKCKEDKNVSNIENNKRCDNYRNRDKRFRSRSRSRKRSRSISRNRLDSRRTYSNDNRNNDYKKNYDRDRDGYNIKNNNSSPFRDSSKYSNSASKGSYKKNDDKNSKRIRID